jgi:hypothetical protein
MVSKVAIEELTEGTETSKYLEEEKSIEIPIVAASELGLDQTGMFTLRGCRTATCICDFRRSVWEGTPKRVKVSYPKDDQS